mgnify:CR=1 FL=1
MTMFSDTRYRCMLHMIRASNGLAAEYSGGNYLMDGHPSTRCSIKWIGATTTDYMEIIVRVEQKDVHSPATPESRLWYIEGPVGIPEFTMVAMYSGNSIDSLSYVWATQLNLMPNGRLGIWINRAAGQGKMHTYFAFRIFNNVSGLPSIVPGSFVQVGELFAGPVIDWPAAEVEIKPVDLSLSNEASDGTIRRVKRTPQRQLTVTITPQTYNKAIAEVGGLTLQDFVYDLIAADSVAVVALPSLHKSLDTYGVSRATSFIACLQDVGGLKFGATNHAAPLTLTFKESL